VSSSAQVSRPLDLPQCLLLYFCHLDCVLSVYTSRPLDLLQDSLFHLWHLDCVLIGLGFSSPRSSSVFATLFLPPGLCPFGLHFSSPRSASGFAILSLAPGLCPHRLRFLVPSIFLSVCYSIFATWIVSFRFTVLVPSIFLAVAYSNFGTWIVESYRFRFLVPSICLRVRYSISGTWIVLLICLSRPLDLPQGSLLCFLAPGLVFGFDFSHLPGFVLHFLVLISGSHFLFTPGFVPSLTLFLFLLSSRLLICHVTLMFY